MAQSMRITAMAGMRWLPKSEPCKVRLMPIMPTDHVKIKSQEARRKGRSTGQPT